MARVLIVYATRNGQTEKVARRMEQALADAGHAVTLCNVDKVGVELAGFDAILVGGPVYASRYPEKLARFVREQRSVLERVPSAFFSVSMALASRVHDGRAQTLPIVEHFQQQTGWRPARVELFAGALAYTRYNWLIRFMMRRIAKKEGGELDASRDHEYTDWAAVERFARDFVATNAARAKTGLPASP